MMTIGEGIANGVQALGAGFQNYQAGIAKAKAVRQVINTYALPGPAGDAMRHLAATGSLPEMEGAIQAMAVKNDQAEREARLNEIRARTAYYGAQEADRQANVLSDQHAGRFLKRFGELTAYHAPMEGTNVSDEEGAQPEATPGLPPQQAFSQTLSEMPPDFYAGGAMSKVMDKLPKWQNVTAKTQEEIDSTPSMMIMPDGGVVYYQKGTKNPLVVSPSSKSDARVREIETQGQSNADKGLLPEGTTFSTTANGLAIAELPDGTIKHLGRAPTTAKGKKEFFAEFMGGGSTNAPAPKPAAGPKADNRITVGKYQVSY